MTAKKYPGTAVINKRYGGKIMHKLVSYYRYGLKLGIYSDAFDELVNIICRRYKNKVQTAISVVGLTGSAKSTFCIQLLTAVGKKLKIPFNLETDYIYSAGDIWDKLKSKPFSPLCLFDEGAVSMNRRRSMSSNNVDISNAFTTLRDWGMISLICVPEDGTNSVPIDTSILTHIEYQVRIYDYRTPLIKDYDKGFFEFSNKVISKRKEVYWNVLFTGGFYDLPDDVKEPYIKIKHDHQNELIEESIRRFNNGKDKKGNKD